MDAVAIVEDEVRELIRLRGLDPASQLAEVRRLVEDAVTDYDERSLLGSLPPLGALEPARRLVFDAVAGFGALQPLLDDNQTGHAACEYCPTVEKFSPPVFQHIRFTCPRCGAYAAQDWRPRNTGIATEAARLYYSIYRVPEIVLGNHASRMEKEHEGFQGHQIRVR